MRHGDGLDADLPAWGQQPVESREVRRPVLLSHRLDHLHADDRVELTLDLSVVLQAQIHPVGQAGLGYPFCGEGQLFGRDRHRGYPCTALSSPYGECSPPGPDLQQARALTYSRVVQDPVDLAKLCLFELRCCCGGSALVEPRCRVAHGGVQEGREQIVAEVVVGADVVAGPVQGVLMVCRDPFVHDRPQSLQGLGDQAGEPG